MALDQQKIVLNGVEYEITPAEVVDVDFSGKNKEKLYSIMCKFVGAFGSQTQYDVVQARALDANIKNIPIIGEIVMLMKGPTAYNSAIGTTQEYYYTNPISIQSSVHHNGLPGATSYLTTTQPYNATAREESRVGILNKVKTRLAVDNTIDKAFAERLDVYPIQPYSGDIIIEGRWGQSIRFGSTIDERRIYPQRPHWKKGLGETGNPILIISNGTNPKSTPFNEFIIENPDVDDASIWLTSGQYLKFTPSSTYSPSIKNKQVSLYEKNELGGNQILISSDRIVLNAKRQEIIGFSKEGIGFSSEKGISLDGKQVVELESNKISLGLNAVSPILLGNRTVQWLADLCIVLQNVVNAIQVQTHPTGVGPSGTPVNSGDFAVANAQLATLLSDLEKLPSKQAFVNENPGGPSAVDQEEAKNRKTNKYVKPSKFGKEGDKPASLLDGIEEDENSYNVEEIIGYNMAIEEQETIKVDVLDSIIDN